MRTPSCWVAEVLGGTIKLMAWLLLVVTEHSIDILGDDVNMWLLDAEFEKRGTCYDQTKTLCPKDET